MEKNSICSWDWDKLSKCAGGCDKAGDTFRCQLPGVTVLLLGRFESFTFTQTDRAGLKSEGNLEYTDGFAHSVHFLQIVSTLLFNKWCAFLEYQMFIFLLAAGSC